MLGRIFQCSYLCPIIRQATLASLSSQLSSQTVPQTPLLKTSTLPYVWLPYAFLKRIMSSEKSLNTFSLIHFIKNIYGVSFHDLNFKNILLHSATYLEI